MFSETHILPGVKEHADFIYSTIESYKSDLMKHVRRLQEVRTKLNNNVLSQNFLVQTFSKQNDPAELEEQIIDDCISDASSYVMSVNTQASNASRNSG